MAGPGCVLGERVREERPAGRARGGGLAGAYQGRIVVVVGFGWAGPQLEPPTPAVVEVTDITHCQESRWELGGLPTRHVDGNFTGL